MKDFKVALILPDMHIPYHDEASLNLIEKVLKDYRVDSVIQLGDFIDAYPISKYSKDPSRATGTEFQRELDVAETVVQRLVEIAPLTIIHGNHEERLNKYLKEKAPGLYGLKNLTIKKLLKVNEYNIDYIDSKYLGNLFVFHGDLWSRSGARHSGQTAMQNVDRSGLNVMLGHIHRMGSYFVTKKGYELQGWEMGCLCKTDVEYCHAPNWQRAFGFVHYRDNGDKAFHVEQIPIYDTKKNNVGRSCFYRGKVYEV